MNLEELKKLRDSRAKKHKVKKHKYYLQQKLAKELKKIAPAIDYATELSDINFKDKIKEIAKKQKQYIDDRKEQILVKMQEYKDSKQHYYKEHKKQRLQYNKQYRERKSEELKEYRKEYYKKNKDKILENQRKNRIKKPKEENNGI